MPNIDNNNNLCSHLTIRTWALLVKICYKIRHIHRYGQNIVRNLKQFNGHLYAWQNVGIEYN